MFQLTFNPGFTLEESLKGLIKLGTFMVGCSFPILEFSFFYILF